MQKKNLLILFSVFFGLLWLYNIVKACRVAFYWDEIYTYLHYVKKGNLIPHQLDKMDANNHPLNTFLIYLCVKLFGHHLFVLRLPNIIAYLFYAFFAYRFAAKASSFLLSICCLCLLLLNPFVNDYFYLARGYGLSLTFLLGSCYFAYRFFIEKGNYSNAIYSLLMMCLATLANLTLVNCLLIVVVAYLFYIIYLFAQHKQTATEYLCKLIPIFISLFILFFEVRYLIRLKKAEALYVGLHSGLWQGVVLANVEKFLYYNATTKWLVPALQFFVLITVLLSAYYVLIYFKNNLKNPKKVFHLFILLFIISCLLLNIAMHLLLNVNYPYGRTGIYYAVFYPLLLQFLLEIFSEQKKWLGLYSSGLVISFLAFNFILNANLSYAIQWKEEGDTKKMIQHLIPELSKRKNHQEIFLGLGFPYHDDIDFYGSFYGINALTHNRDDLAYHCLNDYYFIPLKDTVKLRNVSYCVLHTYEQSASVLLLNLKASENILLHKSSLQFSSKPNASSSKVVAENNSSSISNVNPYSKGLNIIVDSFMEKIPNKINVFGEYKMKSNSDTAKLVIALEREGKLIFWWGKSLSDFINQESVIDSFSVWRLLPVDLKVGDEIKCYFWNQGRNPVLLYNLNCELFTNSGKVKQSNNTSTLH